MEWNIRLELIMCMGETQTWLDSWAQKEGWERLEAMCAPAGWDQSGGGVWAETTPGSSFLPWPEGAGEEEGHRERGGLEEGRRTPAEGFIEEAGAPPSSFPYSVLSLQTQRSAMARGRGTDLPGPQR